MTDRTTHFVYIAECADGSFYTGYTTDVKRRIAEHNDGAGAKYTQPRRPVTLVYHEEYRTKSAAMSREYEIKQQSRSTKERLINAQPPSE